MASCLCPNLSRIIFFDKARLILPVPTTGDISVVFSFKQHLSHDGPIKVSYVHMLTIAFHFHFLFLLHLDRERKQVAFYISKRAVQLSLFSLELTIQSVIQQYPPSFN